MLVGQDVANSGLGGSFKFAGITTSVMPNGRSLAKRNETLLQPEFLNTTLEQKYYHRFQNPFRPIVVNNSDDGIVESTPKISSGDFLLFCDQGLSPPDFAITKIWIRFADIPISPQTIIKQAILKLYIFDISGNDNSGDGFGELINTSIKCFNEDSPSNPISYNDFNSRQKTSASTTFLPGLSVTHAPGAWKIDVTTCVQEVINRSNFGKIIMFAIEENDSADTFPVYSKDSGFSPQLIIN